MFEKRNLCLNWEVGPSLKTLAFSMCANFYRSCCKMHCMNTKILYLVWFKSPEITILKLLVVSIQEWVVQTVAWQWYQWAACISFWAAIVTFSEKSSCETMHWPSQDFFNNSNEAACSLFMNVWSGKVPSCFLSLLKMASSVLVRRTLLSLHFHW